MAARRARDPSPGPAPAPAPARPAARPRAGRRARGLPDQPTGPEAGGARGPGPRGGPPPPQVQSIDTSRGGKEGAPFPSLPPRAPAWPPTPLPVPAPAPGAPDGGCGPREARPEGGRVGRLGRPRARSPTQVAGADFDTRPDVQSCLTVCWALLGRLVETRSELVLYPHRQLLMARGWMKNETKEALSLPRTSPSFTEMVLFPSLAIGEAGEEEKR
ncbi:basic proline-rich protein-like [Meriones unguiculatus]|uniref:basic proline-rich protein-like n=1 Tax=Meriones unguiculatus TaxID=10047 RepID=UPI00293E5EB3|nr:basic proline-rich protein-like [Meriones unguiculatus]